VAVKIVLLVVLLAVASVNRRRVVPALRELAASGSAPGAPGRLLRRTLRAEVALVIAVLGVTAALVSYPPPGAAVAGPQTVERAIGPLQLQLTVDPALAGPNAMHVYLLDARTGAPATGSKELHVMASLPARRIGPLMLDARPAGPGHYVVDGAQLAPAGAWTVTVIDRVSEFDEYEAKATVQIR
jgi:copper transport protein